MSKAGYKTALIYLPDMRDVEISPYGLGNVKIGPKVYTYSLPAGGHVSGSCPGSTNVCEEFCYAKRIGGIVGHIYAENLKRGAAGLPSLPDDATLVRVHVSGDFYSVPYIRAWVRNFEARPDVQGWAYTRSWRVPELLPTLETLRALPNFELFASTDRETGPAPEGWRAAHIAEEFGPNREQPARMHEPPGYEGTRRSLLCPEETDDTPDCETCKFCFVGKKNDVTFLAH